MAILSYLEVDLSQRCCQLLVPFRKEKPLATRVDIVLHLFAVAQWRVGLFTFIFRQRVRRN